MQTGAYLYYGSDTGGDSYPVEAVWRSEDTTVFTVDARGLVRGRAPGRTRLIASARGFDDATYVEVTEGSAARVLEVEPTRAAVYPGHRTRLWSRVRSEYTTYELLFVPISWTSDDPGIVLVTSGSPDSAVAISMGRTILRARAGGVMREASFCVTDLIDLKLVSPAAPVRVGTEFFVGARVRDFCSGEVQTSPTGFGSAESLDPAVGFSYITNRFFARQPGRGRIAGEYNGYRDTLVVEVIP